jgi:hypothetical protein
MNDERQPGGTASSGGRRQRLAQQLEAAIPLANAVDPAVEFFIRLAVKRLKERQSDTSRKKSVDRS